MSGLLSPQRMVTYQHSLAGILTHHCLKTWDPLYSEAKPVSAVWGLCDATGPLPLPRERTQATTPVSEGMITNCDYYTPQTSRDDRRQGGEVRREKAEDEYQLYSTGVVRAEVHSTNLALPQEERPLGTREELLSKALWRKCG